VDFLITIFYSLSLGSVVQIYGSLMIKWENVRVIFYATAIFLEIR
jgi:hypothetical protein